MKKRFTAMLLAVLIMVSCAPLTMFAGAAEDEPTAGENGVMPVEEDGEEGTPEEAKQPTAAGLYQENDAKTNVKYDGDGNPVAWTDELSKADSFYIGFEWDTLAGINKGDYVTLTWPSAQVSSEQITNMTDKGYPCTFTYTYDSATSEAEKTINFGYLTKNNDDDSKITMTFDITSVMIGDIKMDITNAWVFFKCQLSSNLTDADEQGNITINLPGNHNVTVTVTELKPAGPKLEKEVGDLTDDGTVEWTVTYTPQSVNYQGEDIPTQLVDTIPDGLEYVENSFHVTGAASSTGNPKFGTEEGTERTWTYVIPAKENITSESITISYKTRITDATLAQMWQDSSKKDYSFKNTVNGYQGESMGTPVLTADKTLTVPKTWAGQTPMSKSAKFVERDPNTGKRVLNWTVTVNTAAASFTKLIVKDTMGKGLTLVEASVKLDGSTTIEKNTGADAIVKRYQLSEQADDKHVMTIPLILAEDGEKAAATYTITYTTEVSDDYFNNKMTNEDVTNKAELEWAWPTGDGRPTLPELPAVSKQPGDTGLNNALIVKTAKGYNRTDHSITWNITVNPNKVDLQSATITDTLPDGTDSQKPGLSYFESEDDAPTNDEKSAVLAAINQGLTAASLSQQIEMEALTLTKKNLSFDVSAIGTNSFSFTITTYVDDPKIWAGNSSKKFSNRVDMTEIQIKDVDEEKEAHDTTDITYTVDLFKKSAVEYDPAEHRIRWQLSINNDTTNGNVPLTGVTITDTLPAGLICDAATADVKIKRGDSEAEQFPTGEGNEFTVADQKVTIKLSESVTGKVVVSFWTAFEPDTMDVSDKDGTAGANETPDFLELAEITFTNTAVLKSTENAADTETTGALTIDNTTLNKTLPNQTGGDLKLQYKVEVNPNGIQLAEDDVANLKLVDRLAVGLNLDTSSVKLYQAKHSAKNGLVTVSGNKATVALEKDGEAITPLDISFDTANNELTVPLPADKTPYILEYTVYAVRAGVALTNEIKLTGSKVPTTSSNESSQNSYTLTAFSMAKLRAAAGTDYHYIEIKKVDSDGHAITTSAAAFDLYLSPTATTPFTSGTCNITGDDAGSCIIMLSKDEWNKNNLSNDMTVYLEETKAPTGYQKPATRIPAALTFDKDNVAAVTVTNYKTTVESIPATSAIKIKKVDAADPDKALAGAVFGLYTDLACNTPATEGTENVTLTTDANGIASAENLSAGVYYLKELTAPTGYQLSDEVTAVGTSESVAAATAVQITNTKTPTPAPSPVEPNPGTGGGSGGGGGGGSSNGKLVIEKTSADGVKAGFTFRVKGTSYDKTFVTDASGKIELTLATGTYTVSEQETDATAAYVIPEAQTVQLTSRGATLSFFNEKKPAEPVDPADPTTPADPTAPTDPTTPTTPTNPTDPNAGGTQGDTQQNDSLTDIGDGGTPNAGTSAEANGANGGTTAGGHSVSPKTGYRSPAPVLLGLMALSFLGFVLCSLRLRPRRYRGRHVR